MRTLVIHIPDCMCVGCGTKMPGELNNVHSNHNGSMRAMIDAPHGWAKLEPRMDSLKEQMPLRTFFICAACYAKGDDFHQTSVDALYEGRDK